MVTNYINMKTKIKIIFLIIYSFYTISTIPNIKAQDIVINEIMSSNSTYIEDLDGDYSDWIEIYNKSNTLIDLSDYFLSDDNEELQKWQFPYGTTIEANSHLLIFASKKNITTETEIHTNFKISAKGESLYLSKNSTNIIDSCMAVELISNESYGRIPDGGETWTKMDSPSPNESNNQSNKLIFSHDAGYYTEKFELNISSFTGDDIFYTINGDIPTPISKKIKGDLLIECVNSRPNRISEIVSTVEQSSMFPKAWESPQGKIDKATIIRCASFKNGKRTSKIYTKTYFVDPEIFTKHKMPIISLVTKEENFFDEEFGIYVPGVNINEDNLSRSGNFYMRGKEWERDIHIEFFELNGSVGFSQDAGIRIHGGMSRSAAQKSLRLYARSEYGLKNFNYPLLPTRNIKSYKRFVLDSGMSDHLSQTIIKNPLAHKIVEPLKLESRDSRHVIVFLNGEYWGIYNIVDRTDERYIEYTNNVNADSVIIKELPNSEIIEFLNNNNLEEDIYYEVICSKIDIDNFIDYYICEMYLDNYDWPGNNNRSWKKIKDGKWKFIFYDLDDACENNDHNMFEHCTLNNPEIGWPNPPHATLLFRNLILNQNFKEKFISRYAELLKSVFNRKIVDEKLYELKTLYASEIDQHIKRWNFPESHERWEEDITKLQEFYKSRPCIVESQIKDFFALSTFEFDCTDTTNNISNEQISIYPISNEQISIYPNPNNGKFTIFNNINNSEITSIKICDIHGSIIYENNNLSIQTYKTYNINIRNINNGVYIISYNNSNSYPTNKILIVN